MGLFLDGQLRDKKVSWVRQREEPAQLHWWFLGTVPLKSS